ncbi:hypothetical protein [Fangia hongkongensis]|uniref:hypothetical protein n=1 Tax=Fangia hongkongensis TaxID=270495 RepID=UPI00035D2F71|nr:hypothetical protein [Fangia hongkongensis]MBK2124837.1 hypothetical protein [Fangia hongkongensis]
MKILIPHSKFFTLNDLKDLLTNIFDESKVVINSKHHQILGAGGMDDVFVELHNSVYETMHEYQLKDFQRVWQDFATNTKDYDIKTYKSTDDEIDNFAFLFPELNKKISLPHMMDSV